MADWDDLERELAAWRAMGRVPTLWWRDDDTVAPGASLDRLIELTGDAGIPLHLAVVPEGLDSALAARLETATHVWPVQHGWAHRNHEPKGTGASEIGISRPVAACVAEIAQGWRVLQAAGLPRLLPVFVPPWNRLAPEVIPALPEIGFRGLSCSNPRTAAEAAPGLTQVNIHMDPIRWKTGGAFRGTASCLGSLVEHLAARRLGQVDPDEPTGINTHHLQTDEVTWAFLEALIAALEGKVRWVRLEEVLSDG